MYLSCENKMAENIPRVSSLHKQVEKKKKANENAKGKNNANEINAFCM